MENKNDEVRFPETKNKDFRKGSLKKGIILMLICTFLTASGQLVFKMASNNLELSLASIFTNPWLLLGYVMYGTASICMILAFREGKLSTIFPMISLSFVWVFLISTIILHEPVTLIKIISYLIIIAGIILLGGGAK